MKKIFLDVGGHRGETLETILVPKYRFDHIHCFEPSPKLYAYIADAFQKHIRAGKLSVHNYGLADFTGEANLYGAEDGSPNSSDGIGASIYADKVDIDNRQVTLCRFVAASEFVEKHIAKGDYVVLKLNCEGGEAPILQNLLGTGKIHLIDFVMVDFDIRKIPSMKHKQQLILDDLAKAGYANYCLYREVSGAGKLPQQQVTKNWLLLIPQAERVIDLSLGEAIWSRRWQKIWVKLRRFAARFSLPSAATHLDLTLSAEARYTAKVRALRKSRRNWVLLTAAFFFAAGFGFAQYL